MPADTDLRALSGAISAGVSLAPSRAAISLPEGFWLRRCAGVHPAWLPQPLGDLRAALERALDAGSFCAIGEFGLDRRIEDRVSAVLQEEAFVAHLALAKAKNLPVVLHVVQRHGRALSLLQAAAPLRGIVHAFTGSREVAEAYLKLGLCLSFGLQAMKNPRLSALACALPPARVVFETDAPDQGLPSDLPRLIAHIAQQRQAAQHLVEARHLVEAQRLVEAQNDANLRRLFGGEEARIA